jgi:hypothetical protein
VEFGGDPNGERRRQWNTPSGRLHGSIAGTTRAGFQRIVGTVIVDSPAADMDIERLKRTVDLHCAVLAVGQFRSNLAPCRCSQAKPIQA